MIQIKNIVDVFKHLSVDGRKRYENDSVDVKF